MTATTLQREDRVGLLVSIAMHAVVVGVLVVGLPPSRVPAPPERIAVTISDSVGLRSTSPEPDAAAAPDRAPEIGEAPPPVPEVVPTPRPAPVPPPMPSPRTTPSPPPSPKARTTPSPIPQPRPSPSPRASASPVPRAAPAPRPAPAATRPPPRNPGGSRFDEAFRSGVPGAQQTGRSNNPPAPEAGPQVLSALSSAISRQIKPYWTAPQGVDAEKLVTILAWDLNPDGSLAGPPRVLSQQGITEANRPQASRHAEQAVRAVQLAAPFALPLQYYNEWKRVSAFRFDRRLSQ